jgi:DNA-binding Lrp family transcriptional regulator
MQISPEKLDKAADVINAHSGVSHNYARDNAYNLWFTLALAPDESMEDVIDEMGRCAGAISTLVLPMLRSFKIGVYFDMEEEKAGSLNAKGNGFASVTLLSDEEKAAVRELQEDIPLVQRPFDEIAGRLDISGEDLLNLIKSFQQRGVMRRFGALLSHRRAGFTANAMGCWQVGEDSIEEIGTVFASFPEVTHCYQRPTYPDWPYSLFTMIHGKNREETQQIAQTMAERCGNPEHMLLYSSKQYKKTRPKYFIEELVS